MKLTIIIETDNSVFCDGRSAEIIRILRDYAMKLENDEIDPFHYRLHDINGNAVGEAFFR